VTRWAFLDTETGDWIEVAPGTATLVTKATPPPDCGCGHDEGEHYLGCLTCERYGRNHGLVADKEDE